MTNDHPVDHPDGHHEAPPHGHAPTGLQRRWLTFGLLVGLAVCGAAGGVGVLAGFLPNPFAGKAASPGHGPRDHSVPTVKAVRPKKEASVAITAEQIATVEPFYQADLRARASGIVTKVHRDIGDKVRKGDLLIEIDVPEAEQDIARADAMVLQREQELTVSRAKVKDALAAKDVSAATIKQRLADVEGAIATRDLKKRKFERFKGLAARGTVVGSVVEEEERDYLASEATVTSARANVDRARADANETDARYEAALADVELKKAQIEVARKELERARAIANFAKLRAPFDGVIVRRAVDPGSFVQNATTGVSEVLISVARVDIVTVSARFPDSTAASIANGTPAEVRIDDLPGLTIPAAVTRCAPTVANADRTMRVEVDLFNGDADEYRTVVQAFQTGGLERPIKGVEDAAPVPAFANGAASKRRILPGMTARVTVSVGDFGESYVLPAAAVYSRSGTTYILVVADGKTDQVPVRVQMTDGKTVRVATVTQRKGPDGKTREMLADLTGKEAVVVARQLELGDGANVHVGLSEW